MRLNILEVWGIISLILAAGFILGNIGVVFYREIKNKIEYRAKSLSDEAKAEIRKELGKHIYELSLRIQDSDDAVMILRHTANSIENNYHGYIYQGEVSLAFRDYLVSKNIKGEGDVYDP